MTDSMNAYSTFLISINDNVLQNFLGDKIYHIGMQGKSGLATNSVIINQVINVLAMPYYPKLR